MNTTTKTKVLLYVHRDCNAKMEILVFDQIDPNAGTQVIGGTVEEGEELALAIHRELFEEAGLTCHMVDLKPLGQTTYQRKDKPEVNLRHYFTLEGSHLEDEWEHTVDSLGKDNGLVFRFYWLDIPAAKLKLAGNMGELLDLI